MFQTFVQLWLILFNFVQFCSTKFNVSDQKTCVAKYLRLLVPPLGWRVWIPLSQLTAITFTIWKQSHLSNFQWSKNFFDKSCSVPFPIKENVINSHKSSFHHNLNYATDKNIIWQKLLSSPSYQRKRNKKSRLLSFGHNSIETI